MRRRIAATLSALLAVALAGCAAGDPEPPATACFERDRLERALAAAPDPVVLADGTTLSGCVERARNDAQLQSLGTVMTAVAEALADRAIGGGTGAATQLGYLIGAAARGAESTQGVQVELARRLEGAARRAGGTSAEVDAALERGLEAGGREG